MRPHPEDHPFYPGAGPPPVGGDNGAFGDEADEGDDEDGEDGMGGGPNVGAMGGGPLGGFSDGFEAERRFGRGMGRGRHEDLGPAQGPE